MRSRPCPVCESTEALPLYDNAMAPIGGIDMSYRVASCRRCGFGFADRLPPDEDYARYYQHLSKYDQIADRAAVPAVDRERAAAVVEFCRPHLAADALVADLGCGAGVLLAAFRDAGWSRLLGLDPAPAAPAQARQLFGLDGVSSGVLSQAAQRLPLAEVSLVCLTGVLEHLPALREDLGQLLAALAPGTRVLIEVPALERFGKTPCEPFGEFSLEHIQYFSAHALSRLFASLGARCLETRLLALPVGTTDSLLGLFATGGASEPVAAPASAARLDDYLAASCAQMRAALGRLDEFPGGQWLIYGAGSHTARLLPMLEARGLAERIVGIVDGNANLHGQRIGRWTIEPPQAIARHPQCPLLISSFRSQQAIASALAARWPNPLLRLYADA